MRTPLILSEVKSLAASVPSLINCKRNLPNSPNSTWLPRCNSITRFSTLLMSTALTSALDTVVCEAINCENFFKEVVSFTCAWA